MSTGQRIIQASWAGTGLFAVLAVAAAVVPHPLAVVSLVVDLAVFFAGIVVFGWAYFLAVGRSREEEIAVSSLYLLSGSAPPPVRWWLFGSLAVEVAVAFATAGARVNTVLAFGILTPLYGLAMCGLWAARHGTFPRRPPTSGRGRGRARS